MLKCNENESNLIHKIEFFRVDYITEDIYDDDQSGSSYGNVDGQIDAGETIELSVTLTNLGTLNAADVSAELTCNSDYITITQDQSDFGDINAGESAVSQTNYVFEVDKDTPDGQYVSDTLFIYEGTALLHTDVFYFQIGAPELNKEKISVVTSDGDDIIEAGETVELKIELFNEGDAEATGVSAVLTSNSSIITITQNTVNYDDIASLKLSGEDIYPFLFTISEDYDGETLNLEITNEYGRICQFNEFNLNKSDPVEYEYIEFSSMQDEINLWWDPVLDHPYPEYTGIDEYYIRGYNIYRDNGLGVYEKLNDFIIEGTSYYKDTDLDPVTYYYYKITAVTESGRESDQTNSYEAWTALPYLTGWPVSTDVGDNIHGSINISDTDLDGQKDIFSTNVAGYILGFHSTGDEIFDIDNDPGTVSGFMNIDAQIWSTPAMGDIDDDGLSEVVVTTRHDGTDEKKLFVYKTLDEDNDGKPDLLWETDIGQQAWRGPVISDINNDGKLEIIAIGTGGALKVYDDQGNLLWYKDNSYGGYGMPAVADLNNNGYKEIIVGFKDGLYIWQYDGDDYVYNTNPVFDPADYWCVCPPVVADIDNNGNYEIIIILTQYNFNSDIAYITALHGDGSVVDGWAVSEHEIYIGAGSERPHQPPAIAVGDLDNDGDLEIVHGGCDTLYIWDNDGDELQAIYVLGLNVLSIAPILVDIDDDNDIEIVMASYNGKIYGYNFDGTPVCGWPVTTEQDIRTSPCVCDVDNDGKNEVTIGNYAGRIYVWETEGDPSKIEWSCYRNNAHNTGVYNGSVTASGSLTHNETWMENAFITGDVIVPSGITLTIDSSCRVYLTGNGTLFIEDGATLILKNCSRIQGICSENRIEVYGEILIGNNVTFTAPEGEFWGGLYLLNTPATITMNNVTFERGSIFCESRFLVINNSDFTNTGIVHHGYQLTVNESDFSGCGIYCNLKSMKVTPALTEINISNCNFSGYTGYPVYFSNYDYYDLSNNTITDCNGGFDIDRSGNKNHCTISNNIIEDNPYGQGIKLYSSYADIIGYNRVRGNSYGIIGWGNSSITMIGNKTYPLQTVDNNIHEEIVITLDSYPKEISCNSIIDDDFEYGTSDQYLIRCQADFISPRYLVAEYNYWGSASLNWNEWDGDNRFSPSDAFDYIPVWDPGTPRDGGIEGAALLYAEADSLIEEEEYEDAKTIYQTIIDLYALTDFAIYSMRNLLSMETISGYDFSSLREYYLTNPNCNINEDRINLSSYLANYCTIELEEFPQAITFFEDIISDPDTELDSIYAVIDAGFTYLLMENEGKSGYVGKMAELKPKSEKEFRIMRDDLLTKLFGIIATEPEEPNVEYAFELKHNYPNPFNSKTMISFSLPLSTQKAELKIYNIKGQLVRELDINAKSGIRSISWDGLDSYGKKVCSGIYFYKLTADKKETIKKMVIIR